MSYIDIAQYRDEVHVWGRDIEGNLTKETHDVSEFTYCFIPDNKGNGGYKNIYGTPYRKVSFKNQFEMREFVLSRPNDDICESDISPAYKAIHELYHDTDASAPMNVGLFDIEVDFDLKDGKGYPRPENPYGEINSIQIYDKKNNRYIMLIPDHLKNLIDLKDEYDGLPVKIYWTMNEREMLNTFASLEHIDLYSGWFSDGFDLPYIIKRAEKLFGEKAAKTMFCRDGFKLHSRKFLDGYGNESEKFTLVGRQHVDFMELYKKFNPGQKPSFSLDTICEYEEVGKKVQYEDEGDLGTLYRENPQKFYEYALHDVRLLKDLDKKLGIMDLAIMMARMSLVKVADVTGAVKPIEQNLIKFCRENGNIVLPNKKENEVTKIPGAIVYDTVSGVNSWTISVDLTALYPSTMMMLGLSNETAILQCADKDTDYWNIIAKSDKIVEVVDRDTGEADHVTAKDLHGFIVENGFVVSGNGTIFNGQSGLLANFVADKVKRRKFHQKISKTTSDSVEAKINDLIQKVFKIDANSVFGCTCEKSFRLFDPDIASSITHTARVISRHQAVAANKILEDFEQEVKNAV